MKVFKPGFQDNIPDSFPDKVYYQNIAETMNSLSQDEANGIYDYMMGCTIAAEWVSPVRDPLNENVWVA